MTQLTEIQREALKEIINISFGRSVASLAEFLGVFIEMSVPDVQVIRADKIVDFLEQAYEDQGPIHLVQQTFHGEFFGETVLALSAGSSMNLVNMLAKQSGFSPEMAGDKLELEVILEVGNIVMGSCLGRFAELLETSLSFDPPEIFLHKISVGSFRNQISTKNDDALLIHTSFQLEQQEAAGYIFTFLSAECLQWLLNSVDEFLQKMMEGGM
jgi:chemotaxis protein CheC